MIGYHAVLALTLLAPLTVEAPKNVPGRTEATRIELRAKRPDGTVDTAWTEWIPTKTCPVKAKVDPKTHTTGVWYVCEVDLGSLQGRDVSARPLPTDRTLEARSCSGTRCEKVWTRVEMGVPPVPVLGRTDLKPVGEREKVP